MAMVLADVTEAAVCEDTPAAKAAALHALHLRSAPLGVASRSLARGLDGVRRLDALEWLVQAFDALGLPDTELFSAFGLLDRFAAASPAPISASPGAFAVVLAAMLVAVKANGTQNGLERAKRLVAEVSGAQQPWVAVRKAELSMLGRLGFRVCTPTSRDLLDRLIADSTIWDAGCHHKCANLAKFLLELGLVHEPEVLYGPGHPPLALAVAALLLALLAHGAPRQCIEHLCDAARMLEAGSETVVDLAEVMRQRWCAEERRVSSGDGSSAVFEKWLRRVGGCLGVSPPAAGELGYLLRGGVLPVTEAAGASVVVKAATGVPQQQELSSGRAAKPSPPRQASRRPSTVTIAGTNASSEEASGASVLTAAVGKSASSPSAPSSLATGRHVSGNNSREARNSVLTTAEMLAALPTPARQRGAGRCNRNAEAAVANAASAAVAAEQQQRQQQQQQPSSSAGASTQAAAPSLTRGQSTTALPQNAQTAPADGQVLQQLPAPRQTSEQSAPVANAHTSRECLPLTHQQQQRQQQQKQLLSRVAAYELERQQNVVQPSNVATALACRTLPVHCELPTSPREELLADGVGGASPEQRHTDRNTVDLTEVLAMLVPSELLVSSALRMQWPRDRRRVGTSEASATCREAAEALHEAAAQLLTTASTLDTATGCVSARTTSATRRRRTYSGPASGRAVSPLAGTRILPARASPPAHLTGDRGMRA